VPNVGVFSPLTLPYLIAPLWLAPTLTKLLEMGVAALGMTLLLRRRGLGRPAAIVGALAFVNSAFRVVWISGPQSHVGALIPLVFWAVERGVTSPRLRQVWPLAAVGAVMWLEGFPSVTIYALVTAGIYALVRVVAVYGTGRRALARLAALAGAVVLSAGLATLAGPDALGNPGEGVYYGPLSYVEGQSWVGVVTLILLAPLIAGRHRLAPPRGVFTFLVAAGIVGPVVVCFGTPLLAAGSTRLHRWVSPGPLPVASDVAQPSYGRVEPSDDGLQPVHDEGAVVYARTAALPRIRWARRAVIAAQDNDLALLASGLDDDVVVLQRDSAADVVPSAVAVQVVED
jgi:hypothetical protein